MDDTILITLIANICATCILYMAAPAIICFMRLQLTSAQIKKITIINAICIWFICRVIAISNGNTKTTYAVFFWSSIAYATLNKFCLCEKDETATSQTSNVDTSGSAIKPAATPTTKPAAPASIGKSHSRRYCKQCGGVIGSKTKRCSRCGKQYFRPKRFFNILAHILSVTTIICLLCALFYQTQYYESLEQEVKSLKSANSDLNWTVADKEITIRSRDIKIKTLEEKLSFFNENVVFAAEGSTHYHIYDCPLYQEEKDFMAFNSELAEYLGYTPCGWCCG